MKTLIAASAVALATATSAFAIGHEVGLNSSDVSVINSFVPGVDLSNISLEQADALDNLVTAYQSDNEVDMSGAIRLILQQG